MTERPEPPHSTTEWIRQRFRESADAHRPTQEKLPTHIGTYRVIERIGRGSIANVYRVAHPNGREFAIKVIRGDQAGSEALSVFRREANILQSLRHPDIVTLHEVGREQDGFYLVMEYVAGPALQYVIDQGAPREELIPVLARVARAVGHAHTKGIIHRDLKPQNILVGPKGPVVTDFGIARAIDAVTRIKGAAPIGTPTHMAPEQIDRRLAPIGPATDIWALGVILYTLLAKRLPFFDLDTKKLYTAILQSTPPRVEATVPAELECTCLRALQKDPTRRHATALALAEELETTRLKPRAQGWWQKLWRRA